MIAPLFLLSVLMLAGGDRPAVLQPLGRLEHPPIR
ncbi:MAG: hypothetical protein QOE66_2710, partial [Chloroflexota bacterium]|nr:hypothetical protein [Chloroflexota bacterium]